MRHTVVYYLACVFRGLRNAITRKHVKQETWNWRHHAAWYAHECNHWVWAACQCKGSCDCHWGPGEAP